MSTQTHLENTEAALEEWRKLDPGTVNLLEYRRGTLDEIEGKLPDCGTPACFGGWLPYFDHFKALGVTADSTGKPRYGDLYGLYVARELFGDADLFDSRGRENIYDNYLEVDIGIMAFDKTSDWSLVLNRLERHIQHLHHV